MIDLNDLLYGQVATTDVAEFFRHATFQEEHYLVDAIKKHLRTDAQRDWMQISAVSIEDMLNGRVNGHHQQTRMIFEEWNDKLGFVFFGHIDK